jgi:hypothetical protein
VQVVVADVGEKSVLRVTEDDDDGVIGVDVMGM